MGQVLGAASRAASNLIVNNPRLKINSLYTTGPVNDQAGLRSIQDFVKWSIDFRREYLYTKSKTRTADRMHVDYRQG